MRNKYTLVVVLGTIILVACASPTPAPTSTSQPTRTPTDTPSPTDTPTSTPTNTPLPTDTPTPSPTPTPDAVVVVPTLNLREGPGTEYSIAGKLGKDDEVYVVGQYDQCSWLKVSTVEYETGWISGASRYVELRKECETISKGTFRPLTGVIKPNIRGGGYGELEIENGTDSDAMAILTLPDEETTITAAYIRSNDSFTLRGVRDGTYHLFFASGSGWNGEQFTEDVSHQRFDDPFDFSTTSTQYTIWSITLQPVVGGTGTTGSVDPGDFPGVGD